MAIKITFNVDSMGDITGSPVSSRIQQVYADHMQQFLPNDDGTAFLQEHHAADLHGMIPDRKFRELMDGWTVTVHMDPADYGMLLGYDAYHVDPYATK